MKNAAAVDSFLNWIKRETSFENDFYWKDDMGTLDCQIEVSTFL